MSTQTSVLNDLAAKLVVVESANTTDVENITGASG